MADSTIHDRATQLLVAYLTHNRVDIGDIKPLVAGVYEALRSEESAVEEGATKPPLPKPGGVTKPTPAQIRNSVTDDTITCFECGMKVKSMRMHLRRHRMTDKEYLDRWGLPGTYPMTAKSFGERRSELSSKLHPPGRKIGSR